MPDEFQRQSGLGDADKNPTPQEGPVGPLLTNSHLLFEHNDNTDLSILIKLQISLKIM
jgi:hypothetical protein